MFKLIRNLLLVSPAVLGIALSSQLSAVAQSTSGTEPGNTQLLNQLDRYSQEGQGDSVNQVTNVNQLRDVAPTDWAYEALRSLVDRYGCISGFPNQTYRGNQSLSRYEFAAGLNSCLNQIERLIASSEAVVREDVDTINRLAQEFEAELATLGGRIDNIESRTAFLEDHAFSTTTKLEGEAVFGISGEFLHSDKNEVVFQDRVRLAFVSSFTGEDALYTRLDAGNAGTSFQTEVEATGVAQPLQTGSLTYNGGTGNSVGIGWLAYYFPIGEKIDVYLPASGGLWQDFVPTLSPYLDSFTGATGSLSSFAESNPIYKIVTDAPGVGFNFNPVEFVTVSAGFLSKNANDPVAANDGGFANETYAALGQITGTFLDDKLQVAATYVRGELADGGDVYQFGVGTDNANLIPLAGQKVQSNSYGASLAFQLNDRIAFNAFGMFTDAKQNVDSGTALDSEVWSYGAGLSFPDILKEGSLAAVMVGAEPYDGARDKEIPLHIEGFYKYQLNDNISVTPGVVYLLNPNGNDTDEDALIGVLRTTFTF